MKAGCTKQARAKNQHNFMLNKVHAHRCNPRLPDHENFGNWIRREAVCYCWANQCFHWRLTKWKGCSSVEGSWIYCRYLYWIAKNPTRVVLNHSKNLVDKWSAYQMRPAVHQTELWKVQVWAVGQPCPTCYCFTRILWVLHSLLANKGQAKECQFSHWQKRFLAVEGKARTEKQ